MSFVEMLHMITLALVFTYYYSITYATLASLKQLSNTDFVASWWKKKL